MLWLLGLAFAAQTSAVQLAPYVTPPAFPDGMSHIGGYIPSTQLLAWCGSHDAAEMRSCDSFIAGVVETTGMIDAAFPRGPIDVSKGDYVKNITDMRSRVVAYIEAMPRARMSDPASRSVYDALIGKYTYQGKHEAELPYRPAVSEGEPSHASPIETLPKH